MNELRISKGTTGYIVLRIDGQGMPLSESWGCNTLADVMVVLEEYFSRTSQQKE